MEENADGPEFAVKDKKKSEKEIEYLLITAEKAAKKGDYDVAASHYHKIAGIAEYVGDKRAAEFCAEEAKCYIKLGEIQCRMGL